MKRIFLSVGLAVFSVASALADPVEMIKRINHDNFRLPQILALGVAKVESSFNPNAKGAVGEVGLYQLKYATARGIGYSGSLKGLYNPETNVYFGLKHLKIAYEKCGTISGAAKLHNAGLGASCAASAYSYKVQVAGQRLIGSNFDAAVRNVKTRERSAARPPASNSSDLDNIVFTRYEYAAAAN